MKITSVKAYPASSPTTVTRNFVFVKIETDEGITGWGEATCGPLAAATMIEEFGSRCRHERGVAGRPPLGRQRPTVAEPARW